MDNNSSMMHDALCTVSVVHAAMCWQETLGMPIGHMSHALGQGQINQKTG